MSSLYWGPQPSDAQEWLLTPSHSLRCQDECEVLGPKLRSPLYTVCAPAQQVSAPVSSLERNLTLIS